MKKIHLICNSHLDPVWMWDWEEGYGEAISTFHQAELFCRDYDYIFNHNEAVLYEFIEEHDEEFDRAYELLSDDFSRKSFIDVLNFKVSGKVEYLFSCQKAKEEIYSEYLNLGENEIFMDLGAYDGDTVREFISATDGNEVPLDSAVFELAGRRIPISAGQGSLLYGDFVKGMNETAVWMFRPNRKPVPGGLTFG